jgi:hypothetical protein
MRKSISCLAGALGIVAATLVSATCTSAKTIRECNDEYAANKAAIQGSGQKKKDFITTCRAGGETSAPSAATAPVGTQTAAPRVAPEASAPAAKGVKTVRECDNEYAANKAAIQGSGQKKKDFITACRSGSEVIPGGAAAVPSQSQTSAPRTAPTPSAAPPVAAPAPPPAASAPAAAPPPATRTAAPPVRSEPVGAATGAGNQFTGEAQAKASCPGDTVVWVNTRSKVYHFAGFHNYGTTKNGTYMCERAAIAAGNRAPKNEQHP